MTRVSLKESRNLASARSRRLRRILPLGLLVAGLFLLLVPFARAQDEGGEAEEPENDEVANLQPLTEDLEPSLSLAEFEAIAAAASVGGATIFPPDDRIKISPTTGAPWRSLAHLVLADHGGNIIGFCSGAFLNYNVILTAAHCLYDSDFNFYYPNILVLPGSDGSVWPYGTALATRASVPVGWGVGDYRYDFGLLYLDGSPFGSQLAPYLVASHYPNSYFSGPDFELATAGYPGDKSIGTLWFTGAFNATVNSDFINSQMDAYPGQSGSPIMSIDESTNTVPLLGVFSNESPFRNAAVRLTPLRLDALENYCASNGCSIQTKVVGEPQPTPTKTASPTPTATLDPSLFDFHAYLPGVRKD